MMWHTMQDFLLNEEYEFLGFDEGTATPGIFKKAPAESFADADGNGIAEKEGEVERPFQESFTFRFEY